MSYSLTAANHVLESDPMIGHYDDDDNQSSSMILSNQENDSNPDVTLKFISDMMMEEDDEMKYMPCILHDCLAYQAAQDSLYAVLTNNETSGYYGGDEDEILKISMEWLERRKEHHRNGGEEMREDDRVLLSSGICPFLESVHRSKAGKRGKKDDKGNELVDLISLLTACAQAVANFDKGGANNLLGQIRSHSSPSGDSLQRVVHYLANALEARLNGTGAALYASHNSSKRRRSVAEVTKAYIKFITACPFRKMSCLLANKAIEKLAVGAKTLHIVDFGIVNGFQWPSLIQMLSERHGGPPKLRITGIGFPKKGDLPAEAFQETGRRLAVLCERLGVSFEYNAIDKKWENIRVEDLKIKKDELLVFNSLYWFHYLLDETVVLNNPRDAVLKLIRNSNPALFIHGVSNGQYSSPFFATRFKEALFHFSNMFDMFEATVPDEDEDRLIFEEHMFGKEAMNVIACEGTERYEMPETYMSWHFRMERAGLRQVPLDQEVVKYVLSTVKMAYHKNFCVDEDGMWLLLGWNIVSVRPSPVGSLQTTLIDYRHLHARTL